MSTALRAPGRPAVAAEPFAIVEFDAGPDPREVPTAIVRGGDAALWFTLRGAIGRITTDGEVSVIPLPRASTPPGLLTTGGEGALWLTHDGVVARLTVAGDLTIARPFPWPRAEPGGIAPGPGGGLWVTTPGDGAILAVGGDGRADRFTAGLRRGARPGPVVADGAGGAWFGDGLTPASIGWISPDGRITGMGLTRIGPPVSALATSSDGALWYARAEDVGRLHPEEDTDEVWRRRAATGPVAALAEGPDGAMWFAASGAGGAIGRIDGEGRLTEARAGFTPGGAPTGLAPGPDDAMWFTLPGAGRVGRIAAPASGS